ncbi:hypothetical protein QQP08_015063 [Theobroma cacao]|nr:hypothetical protein QQP08_015063 [Theobroma cacao]
MEKLGFALELQETADAGKEKIKPAGEHSYQDILFPLARDIDVDTLGSNFWKEIGSEKRDGIKLKLIDLLCKTAEYQPKFY